MGGSDFRGVIEKKHTFVRTRDRAGLGHPPPPTMLATDAEWWGSL
jgi:hypothetical protein